MTAVLIVNPRASGVGPGTLEAVARAWQARLATDVVVTTGAGHARAAARAAVTAGSTKVIAVLGGDGTLNEAVNGIADGHAHQHEPPGPHERGGPTVVALPGGSTNVFARAVGLPRDPLAATGVALDALGSDATAPLGVGLVNGRWFLSNCGIGFDGAVTARADARPDRKRRWGVMWFGACALAELRHRRSATAVLDVSTPSGQRPARWLVALPRGRAHTPYSYAGRWAINLVGPSSPAAAGLAVVCFDRANARQVAGAGFRAIAGRPQGAVGRGVTVEPSTPSVLVTASLPVAAQVDGDALEPVQRFELSYLPGALRTIVVAGEPRRRRVSWR